MMQRVHDWIAKQGHALLSHYFYAVLFAVLFIFVPFFAWMSCVVVAFVTLRKGPREGALVLVPVALLHLAWSLVSLPYGISLINSLLTYIPVYLAAVTLYLTSRWRVVAMVFFIQVLAVLLIVQAVIPNFVDAQLLYIKLVAKHAEYGNSLTDFLKDLSIDQQMNLAHYVLGIQAMTIVMYALFSLCVARALQARLFYPGGFQNELLTFRGEKEDCFVFLMIALGALYHATTAIDMLPLLMFFFMLAGLSLSAHFCAIKKMRQYGAILVVMLIALPFVMGPFYIVLGFLDSLLNFRVRRLRV